MHILNQRHVLRWSLLAITCLMLNGCLGGSIAQQIVSSALLHGADKVTGAAIEAHEKNAAIEAQKNAKIDPYTEAFMNMGFEKVTPQIEPLPETAVVEEEKESPLIQESKLVQVEIWGILAGSEKESVLEKARMQGSLDIPPKPEWKKWQVATGAAKNSQQAIIFLISPEIGRMRSGEKAMVEIMPENALSLARYNLN